MIIDVGHEAARRGARAQSSSQRSGVVGGPAWHCPGAGTDLQGETGPVRADQLRPGDPYELSDGHLIECAPTGGSGSCSNRLGASVVGWDPAVEQAGVDTGYALRPAVLRAPDVAIGNVPDTPGWVPGAPDLALEYADVGQDEDKLAKKVQDLLEAGTQLVWVVRLVGPRRVEVYRLGEPPQVAWPGEHLSAPGILKNPVLVESLYDREHAERATLTNLLQRRGYESLEAVREAGWEDGRLAEARAAVRRVLSRRGLAPGAGEEARLQACADRLMLRRWLGEAVVAASAADALR